MKRIIAIEIDCGQVVCGDCDWFNKREESCDMFQMGLVDDCVRDPLCHKAEERAIDLSIKAARENRTPEGATE